MHCGQCRDAATRLEAVRHTLQPAAVKVQQQQQQQQQQQCKQKLSDHMGS
jgi:hypothetical protein